MKYFVRFFTLCVVVVALMACARANDYTKQLEAEQQKIDTWLAHQGYNVVTECPADSLFVPGTWYHFDVEGIYFCIEEQGTGARVNDGDQLVVRYIESTLDNPPVVHSYWTTLDRPNPEPVTKGTLANSCAGWDYAFDVMRTSGTVAQLIVPSKLGFSAAVTSVEPYHFKLSMHLVAK